ncbi:protein DpdG [Candidatus Poriferisodalis sp.]|uniref:protein DpdG n=1 Tax=Candidatus Poriferisodalis sp. TaxID=3101277 RepID=UPI003B014A5B
MALLNPPELRASTMSIIVYYLAQRRGQRDEHARIIDAVSPPSLTESPEKHQLDAIRNLTSVVEIGLANRDSDRIELSSESTKAAKEGSSAIAALIRQRVLSEDLNTSPWGSQEGARDLTNALAWFLTFGPTSAPARMEGDPPSAKSLQEVDFGARHSDDDDASGWPISNSTRWIAFQRWACSLGFAWRSPSGRLVPDPTPAVRDSIPSIFENKSTLDGETFVAALGKQLPVLESGAYRRFVEENWRRTPESSGALSAATTDALQRLESSGYLNFENRADAPRVSRVDGSTFSHVSKGRE